jgi:hypothetical protein
MSIHTDTSSTLTSRLFALSREAHESGRHEAAYHALTACMHAADDDHDDAALGAVAREAREQLAWIDVNVPEQRLSTASARARHHAGVYETLVRQTEAHLAMLRHASTAERRT